MVNSQCVNSEWSIVNGEPVTSIHGKLRNPHMPIDEAFPDST